MPSYTVSLAVLGECLRSEQLRALAAILQPWFDSCNVQRGVSRYAHVLLDLNPTEGTSANSSLLIYFMTSREESVIVHSTNFRGIPEGKGYTLHPAVSTGNAASEVYVSAHPREDGSLDLQDMAITVFHEAMHNQLYMAENLHSRGGAAASPGTHPTLENFRLMHASLATRRPQWRDGWTWYERIRIPSDF